MTDVGSNYRYCAPGSVERAIYAPCEFDRESLSTLAMLLMHKIIAILLHEKIYDIEFLRLRHLFPFPLSLPCSAHACVCVCARARGFRYCARVRLSLHERHISYVIRLLTRMLSGRTKCCTAAKKPHLQSN